MKDSVLERGEIYFFYRPKLEAVEVCGLSDIQRFYFCLVPDGRRRARLFVVGHKQLPDIVEGPAGSTERDWALLDLVEEPTSMARVLEPLTEDGKTSGLGKQARAVPLGEGRYALFALHESTRLGYRLTRPRQRGRAQVALGVRSEATYVLSVRNPEIKEPGFVGKSPNYPKTLLTKFSNRRFIEVDQLELLDYEGAQFLLIGANDSLEQSGLELGGSADVFQRFELNRDTFQSQPLESGDFAQDSPGLSSPSLSSPSQGPTSD